MKGPGCFPIILSSPSGAGKTTIARALLEVRPDIGYSVSCTTRQPRAGEVEGKDYYFLSRTEFIRRMDEGAFAESAEVHGNLYGTLKTEVERVLRGGQHVMMDIDIQGAARLRRVVPSVVTIFILPPSGEVMLERLRKRKTEEKAAIVRRLESALQELQAVEDYEYVVVNDVLEESVRRVSSIIDAEVVSRERVAGLREQVSTLIRRLEDEIETHSS
ncbi:MAG TPA: guanylate kinase [Gemmatimonadaceae bacterium]|nr:guanylate kinase [Gemmatimonadaceae bacterium]